MAGSIAYISFPPFTRRRTFPLAGLTTMCLHLMKALLALGNVTSCFYRSEQSVDDEHPTGTPKDIPQPGFALNTRRSSAQRPEADTTLARPCSIYSCTTCSLEHDDHAEGSKLTPHQNKPKSKSGSPILASPLHSTRSTIFRGRLLRRLSSWRSTDLGLTESVNDTNTVTATSTTRLTEVHARDSAFIAQLDALSLTAEELETLHRMEQVCQTANATRDRRCHVHNLDSVHDRSHTPAAASEFNTLRLRGGGSDSSPSPQPLRGPRRRTTLPYSLPSPPAADSERPNRMLWWLAGGRKGEVPTFGELRVRKEVEGENRRVVGFWGTVLRSRRVGNVGVLDLGGGDGADVDAAFDALTRVGGGDEVGRDGGGRVGSVKSVRSGGHGAVMGSGGGSAKSGSHGSVTEADGGSVRGSGDACGLEDGDSGEAKARRTLSADGGTGGAEEDSASEKERKHLHAEVESVAEAAVGTGHAKAESARGVDVP